MTQPVKKRSRGRPPKEESVAIKADKAILDYKAGIVDLLPDALNTLKTLMNSAGSEKVKEGVAKFIIEETKEFYRQWSAEDEDTPSTIASVEDENEDDDVMPISLEIRK